MRNIKLTIEYDGKGFNRLAATTKGIPTIESVLREGKYVWYTDAYRKQQKCIVLYGPENSNYSSYGIQIITADTVENVTLGVENDFNASRNSYNNAIITLNAKAEKYRKKDDGIAEVARCVGSMPDNPSSEAGMYTRNDSWFSSYNNTFKDEDTNYTADYNQMNSLGIHNIEKGYWLASRYVIANSKITHFHVRTVYFRGDLGYPTMCRMGSDGDTGAYDYAYDLRLVFHLKSGIKVIGGDGSEGNPYTLAPK